MDISIVSPIYKGRSCLEPFVKAVVETLSPLNKKIEIVLVDDGCPQNSWEVIEQVASNYACVVGVKLSRNFGQHMAITAGLTVAKGERVIVMDSDLQENPKYIPEMLLLADEGNQIVYTRRPKREHSLFKNITARLYHVVMNKLSDTGGGAKYDPQVGTMSLLSRKVVDSYLKIEDCHRHYLMILRWLGYKHAFLEIEHEKRESGRSSYNVHRMLSHAIDGVVSQSVRVLRYSIFFGFALVLIALIGIIAITYLHLTYGLKEGWPSIIVAILGSTGLILFFSGVNGMYIGKNFEQTKRRPLFIIEDIKGGR